MGASAEEPEVPVAARLAGFLDAGFRNFQAGGPSLCARAPSPPLPKYFRLMCSISLSVSRWLWLPRPASPECCPTTSDLLIPGPSRRWLPSLLPPSRCSEIFWLLSSSPEASSGDAFAAKCTARGGSLEKALDPRRPGAGAWASLRISFKNLRSSVLDRNATLAWPPRWGFPPAPVGERTRCGPPRFLKNPDLARSDWSSRAKSLPVPLSCPLPVLRCSSRRSAFGRRGRPEAVDWIILRFSLRES